MKHVLQILAVGVLAGLFLVGCSSASSGSDDPPSYTTASAEEQADIDAANTYVNAVLDASLSAAEASNTSTGVSGITYTGSYTDDNSYNLTITLTNYVDSSNNTISGTLSIKVTNNGTNKVTAHEVGNFVVSDGPNAGTFKCDITGTTTYSGTTYTDKESGTFTVNGKKYSYSQSFSGTLSSSIASHHAPFAIRLK